MRPFILFAIVLSFMVLATSSLWRSRRPLDRPDDEPSFEGTNGWLLAHGPNPLLERSAAKYQIALQVIRGELGLFEGAARVRELYGNDNVIMRGLRPIHPEATDDELYAWSVISEVDSELRDCPLWRAIHVWRLQAEITGYSSRDSA
ncbi:MAG TPA: hypothetical protein VHR66_05565 [Gemmataceae bacterium]|jgi:hypothetical protein|nr:hypothetical protein [Gemmataceae bacterium]